MKKLLLTTALMTVLGGASAANAQISVGIGINQPYYEPAPVYYDEPVRPIYYPHGYERHRDYDWSYWNQRDEHHDEGDNHHDDGRGHDKNDHHDNGWRGNDKGHGKGHDDHDNGRR